MEVSGTSGSINGVPLVDPDKTGFNSLDSESFMKLLITQLENQDPTEPVGNEQLLNQLSMMRNLQSNIELAEAFETITTSQQLSTAASYIGKTVTGISENEDRTITGVVDRAFLEDGKVYVGIGNDRLPVEKISRIEQSAA